MKLRLLVSMLFFALVSHATTYYFSSSKGKDANPINSINTPWASLRRASGLHLQPGDRVLFNCSDTWTGTFTPIGAGTATKPIIFGAYGTGAHPIFSGLTTITSWVAVGNGIFKSNPISPQSQLHLVLMDGVNTEQGRYPNRDAPDQGWLRLQRCINGNTLVDYLLPTTPINASWKGATVMIRPYRSYLNDCPITNVDLVSNSITFDPHNLSVPVGDNYGYFITNSIKTLDQLGEWYYNPSDKCLYMYFGTELPTRHTVQASTTDILFHPAYDHYIIDRIKFTGANKYAIECNYTNRIGLTVQNCYVGQIGITGIALNNRRDFKLYNTVVEQANNNGVILGYRCDNDSILYNRINDIGMLPANYYKDSVYQRRAGFALFSSDQEMIGLTAMYNHIYNVGFMGIFFNKSNNFVYKNYIHDFEKLLDDGAGIYSGNAPNPFINGNNIVRRNVVVHGLGNGYGGLVYNYLMGDAFFVDDWASPTTLDSNVAMYCGDYGIDIHNALYPNVINNVVGFNQKYQIHLQHDYGHPDTHATIINNWLYSDNQLVYGFYIESAATYNNVGYVDNNIIAMTKQADVNMAYTQSLYITNYTAFYAYPDWVLHTGYDTHSTFRNYPYGYATATGYYTSTKPTTIKFPGQVLFKLDGTPVQDSITLPDYSGIILIKYNTPIAKNKQTPQQYGTDRHVFFGAHE